MKNSDLIREIVGTYRKHDWVLRRVLASEEMLKELGDSLPPDVPLEVSDVNALWFSRPSGKNREAWELRSISASPFALFETFPLETGEEERENACRELENRLRERQAKADVRKPGN
jgi:hypothetical protein